MFHRVFWIHCFINLMVSLQCNLLHRKEIITRIFFSNIVYKDIKALLLYFSSGSSDNYIIIVREILALSAVQYFLRHLKVNILYDHLRNLLFPFSVPFYYIIFPYVPAAFLLSYIFADLCCSCIYFSLRKIYKTKT